MRGFGFTMELNKIYKGNALEVLKTFSGVFVDCVMTSPPYWALRDYGSSVETIWDGIIECQHEWGDKIIHKRFGNVGTNPQVGNQKEDSMKGTENNGNYCRKCKAWKGQLGLEPTFELFIKHLCDIFDEVKRVLKKTGTCWVNLGDTYCGGGSGQKDTGKHGYPSEVMCGTGNKPSTNQDYPNKCLTLIPFRFAIEMINRGWILRNVIIWHKSNCMPSSVKDRFTVDFEYLFFFVKNKKYFFETQYEPMNQAEMEYRSKIRKGKKYNLNNSAESNKWMLQNYNDGLRINPLGRNKRTVWTINPKPFPEAHFAVYPEELCETPIRAGTPYKVCPKCKKGLTKEEFENAKTL